MIIYLKDDIFDLNEARLSPFDRGFLFGDGVYEGIRTYNKKYFLFDEHLTRLKRNCVELLIDFYDFDSIRDISNKLIIKNNLTESEVSLYIQITRGGNFPRMHSFPPDKTKPTLFAFVYEIKDPSFETAAVITAEDLRWKRCDIKSLNLLPSILANQNAKAKGYSESIWTNDGKFLEGTHTNIFAVKQNKVITPPLSNSILPGITRGYIIELCKKNNIKISEEDIEIKNLKDYDEFFLTGTMTEIKPVIKINDLVIGNGNTGKLTKKIIKMFSSAVSKNV